MIKLINSEGEQRILPSTIFFKRVPFDLNVPFQHLPGRDGAIITGTPTIQPRLFTLEGRIYHQGDKEKVKREADSLLVFLMAVPIEVHLGDRFLVSYPQGMPQQWIDEGIELELQIPMLAADPYFYGELVELTLEGAEIIVVSGNARAIPFIKTENSAADFTMTNNRTNQEVRITGASGIIEIDNFNHRVKVEGVDRLDLANDEWLISGFSLLPGENLVSVNAKAKLSFRPRWL
ncbi:MAG: hypothetical protein QM401_11545 [Bacillota bacterium]|nr:hypothetical protein [Bacillota bacterium]